MILALNVTATSVVAGENKDALDKTPQQTTLKNYSKANIGFGLVESIWIYHAELEKKPLIVIRQKEIEHELKQLQRIDTQKFYNLNNVDVSLKKADLEKSKKFLSRIQRMQNILTTIYIITTIDGLARIAVGLTSEERNVGALAIDDAIIDGSRKVSDFVGSKLTPKKEVTRNLADGQTDVAIK